MRTIRSVLVLAVLALAGGLAAQQIERPTTSDQVVEWMGKRIEEAFQARSGRSNGLKDHRWHFVFMFNSSRAGARSAYTEFTKSAINAFIDKRTQETEGSAEKDLFSFYAYQLDLYGGAYAVQSIPLTRQAIPALEAAFPKLPFPNRLDGRPMPDENGHDNSGTRRALMDFLGSPDRDKPILLVQFTDIAINEDPGNQRNDGVIRRQSGQLSNLEGTGFVAYEVPGQPFSARSVTVSFNVHVWMYGPSQFANIVNMGSTPPPSARGSTATGGGAGIDFGGWLPWVLGVLVAVAALIAAGVFASKQGYLAMGSKSIRVTVGDTPVALQGADIVVVGGDGCGQKTDGTLLLLKNAPPHELFLLQKRGGGVVLKPQLGTIKENDAIVSQKKLEPGRTYDFYYEYEKYKRTISIRVEVV